MKFKYGIHEISDKTNYRAEKKEDIRILCSLYIFF